MFPDIVVYPHWLARPTFFPCGCVPVRLRRLGLPPPFPLLLEFLANLPNPAAYLDPASVLPWRGFCPVVCPVYRLLASLSCLVYVCLWLGRLFPEPPSPSAGLRLCCICPHFLKLSPDGLCYWVVFGLHSPLWNKGSDVLVHWRCLTLLF